VVAIISPADRVLAYNNNHATDNADLGDSDALIPTLSLPDDGTYTLYVNTYGGIYAGELRMTLSDIDPFNVADDNETRTITLPAGQPYRQTLTLEAGAVVTIIARDLNRTIDPALTLLDDAGEQIAFNDDHPGMDLTLDAFDAALYAVEITRTSDYTLVLWEMLGSGGEIELTIQR